MRDTDKGQVDFFENTAELENYWQRTSNMDTVLSQLIRITVQLVGQYTLCTDSNVIFLVDTTNDPKAKGVSILLSFLTDM